MFNMIFIQNRFYSFLFILMCTHHKHTDEFDLMSFTDHRAGNKITSHASSNPFVSCSFTQISSIRSTPSSSHLSQNELLWLYLTIMLMSDFSDQLYTVIAVTVTHQIPLVYDTEEKQSKCPEAFERDRTQGTGHTVKPSRMFD